MTPDEVRIDCYRSWLFALAMLATDCDADKALPLFRRWAKEHGVGVA